MRRIHAFAMFGPVLGLASLTGCSLFHSNVRGAFACAAPRGTCAPSTTIDDAALKAIEGSDGQAKPNADAGHGPVSGKATAKEWIYVGNGHPALRIVYPAWRDDAGHVHARTTAYMPVDAPRLPVANVAAMDAGQLSLHGESSLLSIAESAPDAGLIGTPTIVPPAEPKPGAVTPAASPIDAIKAAVHDILTAAPKPQAGPPTATATPAPKLPAASFPPKAD